MTLTEYLELHKNTLESIVEHDYYTDKLVYVLSTFGYTYETVGECTDVLILKRIWQKYYENLPDLKSIRLPVYYEILKLAGISQ